MYPNRAGSSFCRFTSPVMVAPDADNDVRTVVPWDLWTSTTGVACADGATTRPPARRAAEVASATSPRRREEEVRVVLC
ncbi:hypothetical protein GCM10010102_04080 [Promicromonospora citrea]|uniref:Uncharacterized protein n=1 Tax=Promicromonospora citrea TaxID=43677 RepID=A0A8H9GD65_9MICO|nr:hypothetical protein GCM10010102_04080 [Promicromonospora citrea]